MKKTAETTYITQMDQIETLMADIKKGLAKHQADFKSSGRQNWGYVGDADAISSDLADIADALLRRGEYAPE